MTKYLVTGDGRRLLTGSGMPLTADAPGDAYQDATLEPATLALNAAPIAATSVVAVALAAATLGFVAAPVQAEVVTDENAVQLEPVTLAFDAQPVAASTTLPVGLESASIAFDAAPIECGAAVSVSASPVTLGFDAQPVTAIIASITPVELAPATLAWQCAPLGAMRIIGTGLQPVTLGFDAPPVAAFRLARTPVAMQKATLGFSVLPIAATQSAAAKFRGYWLTAYGARQTVLNAIDANNRFLAKQAGDKAQATADALVITDTRVQQIDDTVTAQGTRIEQVSASIAGSGGNLLRKSDFSDLAVTGWINALAAAAPASGAGSQPTTTYQGPYLTTVAGGTYEDNWFPATPGEVFDVAANAFNTTNTTGLFGLHFQDAQGNNLDWRAPESPAAGAWARMSGQVTAPAGTYRARAWLHAGSGGNNIRITRPDVRRQGAGTGANAAGLSSLTVTVTSQGDTITSQGNALTSLQSQVDGKLNASAIDNYYTKTETDGVAASAAAVATTALKSSMEAPSGSVGQLQSTLVNNYYTKTETDGVATTAATGAVTSAVASLGGSGNLLENADFALQQEVSGGGYFTATGWSVVYNPGNWGPLQIGLAGPSWTPSGCVSIGVNHPGTPATDGYAVIYSTPEAVEPGARYIFSALTANHRCTSRLAMKFLTSGGGTVSEHGGDWSAVNNNGGASLANWEFRWLSVVAPANAATVQAGPWARGNGGANAYFWMTRPQLERASASQTQPSPWSPGGSTRQVASAVTDLTTRVEVNEQGVAQAKATWGVYLTAGNVISGVQSINNGIVAEFNVMAHVFRLLSPAGADGMEIQDGYIRIWKGNSQTIIGNNFGVAGQKLMKWFGPNIGAANCTKANATIWEDGDGNAYFGGQVLQGVLRFFNSTTATSSSASVETGQNNSNGKPKAISVRYTFDAFQNYPNLTGQITPESGMTSAVIAIERQYSGGGWTELGRRTMVGQVEYEKSDVSFILWTISGSMTVTDADSSTASRSYRARIVSRSEKPFTVTNPGVTPAVVLSQYLSVESME